MRTRAGALELENLSAFSHKGEKGRKKGYRSALRWRLLRRESICILCGVEKGEKQPA